MTYRHPDLGFSLELPPARQVVSELPPLFALPPPRGAERPPTVVVTCEALSAEVTPSAWVDEGLRRQGQTVSASLLVDRRPIEPREGLEGERTLTSLVRGGEALTVEQWWHPRPGRGWTVTASSATADYDAAADALRLVAESFETT